MRTHLVILACVRFQNPTQMRLAQDNHMIDALAPDRSDLPFAKPFCQGRAGVMGLLSLTNIKTIRQQRCLEAASRPRHVLEQSMRRVGLIEIPVATAKRLGASQRSTTRRCASHHIATQRANRWGHPAALARLARTVTLTGPLPRYHYSIIGRPIQSLLSQRTAKSGCLSPCKRAWAS
jgi:hypothetical protein